MRAGGAIGIWVRVSRFEHREFLSTRRRKAQNTLAYELACALWQHIARIAACHIDDRADVVGDIVLNLCEQVCDGRDDGAGLLAELGDHGAEDHNMVLSVCDGILEPCNAVFEAAAALIAYRQAQSAGGAAEVEQHGCPR